MERPAQGLVGPGLAAATALGSTGLALATMKWLAAAGEPRDPHAAALAAGALAVAAVLLVAKHPYRMAACLVISAGVAIPDALSDASQWLAPLGYLAAACVTAVVNAQPWWARYQRGKRLAVAAAYIFIVGSVFAARVGVESGNWDLSAVVAWLVLGLAAVALAAGALWLAWHRGNPWPLLVVTVLLTAWTILALPSIGIVFAPLAVAFWVATVRLLRRGRRSDVPQH